MKITRYNQSSQTILKNCFKYLVQCVSQDILKGGSEYLKQKSFYLMSFDEFPSHTYFILVKMKSKVIDFMANTIAHIKIKIKEKQVGKLNGLAQGVLIKMLLSIT